MRLSLALGIPVGELQQRMSSREFAEYLALWRLEPWGDARGDIQAAMIATTIANHLGRKRRRLADFLPDWLKGRGRNRATTPEAMIALARQFATAHNEAGRRK